MLNSEILEIKKQFNHENCSITKVSGCYVDGEKTIKSKFTETFLCLPEEETFKYFDIFKKTLSGSIGKNLINMELPTASEVIGGTPEYLMQLRDSELKDETIIDEFYERMVQHYEHVGNYLVLLIYAAYDVPGKTKDKMQMEDASEEIYRYILCSICPVKLSKPGLSYHDDSNMIHKRIQDWVVDVPSNGFLFPAFNDRSADIHSLLYYSKNSEDINNDFVKNMFGCKSQMAAGEQKEVFQQLIETLGEGCEYETIKNIHEKINNLIKEHKTREIPEPLLLYKTEIKNILSDSGAKEESLVEFEQKFEKIAGEDTSLMANNIVNTRTFEVKTPDIVIKVNPDRTDLVQTKTIDSRKCLIIEINDKVEVNGISVTVN